MNTLVEIWDSQAGTDFSGLNLLPFGIKIRPVGKNLVKFQYRASTARY